MTASNKKKKRLDVEAKFAIMRTTLAIAIGLTAAILLIVLTSDMRLEAVKYFLFGPLMKKAYFYNVIEKMIPMLFTGTAVSIMFSANQFNLGTEGTFYAGGMIGAICGIYFPLPNGINQIVSICLGGLIGAVISMIPAFLKYKWNASELVSSLMLNYIVLQAGCYFLLYYLRDTKSGNPVTQRLPAEAKLGALIPNSRIHAGLIIAAALIILSWFFLYRTRWGFALRAVGRNQLFAAYSGINVGMTVLLSQAVGGFIGGMGGAVEILGIYPRFSWTALTGLGWDGVTVAIFAKNNPKYVPLSALFLAYLRKSADLMSTKADVQTDLVGVIEGIMVLLILADQFLSGYHKKLIFKEAIERRTEEKKELALNGKEG